MQKKKTPPFDLFQGQIQTYAAFAGTMTAVVLFFVGLILTNISEFDPSIKIPVAFLLISVFGFLYGSIIYTNAAHEVSAEHEKEFKLAIFLGDIISEYLGVYLLIISVPLVINVTVNDVFLRLISLASCLIGLTIYQFSHFSIIERHFQHRHKPISLLMIFFGLILFLAQLFHFYFLEIAIAFGIFSLIITYIASRQPVRS